MKNTKSKLSSELNTGISFTELCLGNLIDCFGECEVIGINEKKIKVRRKSESGLSFIIEKIPKYSMDLKSIPITIDRILIFGFKKQITPDYYELLKKGEYFLTYDFNNKKLGIYINNTRGIRHWIDCYSVHKLQNLISFLTPKNSK